MKGSIFDDPIYCIQHDLCKDFEDVLHSISLHADRKTQNVLSVS